MFVFNWLKSFLAPKQVQPAPVAQTDPAPDPGVRIHRAAHDPHFPQKREKAIELIHDAMDATAFSHGFTAKPRSWVKTGPMGKVSFYLQRSRYGFEASIYLVFFPASLPATGIWAEEEELPLAWFYPPEEAATAEALIYLDVIEQPETLSRAMQILSQDALPWLEAHLTEAAPDIDAGVPPVGAPN